MTESKYGFSSQEPKVEPRTTPPTAAPQPSPAVEAAKDVLSDLARTIDANFGSDGQKLTLGRSGYRYSPGIHELGQVHPGYIIAEVTVTDSGVDLHFNNPASISEENKKKLIDVLHQSTGKPVNATRPLTMREMDQRVEDNARRLEADIKSGKVDPKNIFWGGHQAEYDD